MKDFRENILDKSQVASTINNNSFSLAKIAKISDNLGQNFNKSTKDENQTVKSSVIDSRFKTEDSLYQISNKLIDKAVKEYNNNPKENLDLALKDFNSALKEDQNLNKMLKIDSSKTRQDLVMQLRSDLELKKQILLAFKHNVKAKEQYNVGLEINQLLSPKSDSVSDEIILSNLKQYKLDKLVLDAKQAKTNTDNDIINLVQTNSALQKSQDNSMEIHKDLSQIYFVNGAKSKSINELNKYLDLKNNPIPQTLSIDPSEIIGVLPKLNDV